MKKLGLFNKFIFFLNSIVAVLLLCSLVLPYISPKSFPTLSILSLMVSPLIILNILFFIYWVIRLRKQFMLSAVMIAMAFIFFNSFYIVGNNVSEVDYKNKLTVLSFNVHLFNMHREGTIEKSDDFFNEIIEAHQPDLMVFQEYNEKSAPKLEAYPYKYEHFTYTTKSDGTRVKKYLGHAVFSKYPLINKGAFDFKRTVNNTLFVDVVKDEDTIRLYNLHLKSFGISPDVSSLQEGDKKKLIGRISFAFKEQANQVEAILQHKNNSPYPVIIAGDFNNTAFSYIYNQLTEGMKDSFAECGSGLGTTFDFDGFPLRIDYILAQDKFNILSFETIDKTFSDHHPIIAILGWD